MIVILNIGRVLMVGWALYSLLLTFFPALVHHAPDRIGGAIQFVTAYTIGYGLDRILGWVKRCRAQRVAEPPAAPDVGSI